jgi:acyl-CoA reductase-like NAD-dependent aldehyde dehydrogenase
VPGKAGPGKAGPGKAGPGKAGQCREAVTRGTGLSGLGGRSGGEAGIEAFTGRRWLTVNTEPAHYPY